MSRTVGKILLWLFVLNLGIAFGAGLYESRIVVPEWLLGSAETGYLWSAEAAREDNTGLRFWVYVTTVPLTLITLANLIAAWKVHGSARPWWAFAAMAALADRVFTFSYFIPTMLRLTGEGSLSGSEGEALARQWVSLNYVRHAIVLVAWLSALKAFALFHRGRSYL